MIRAKEIAEIWFNSKKKLYRYEREEGDLEFGIFYVEGNLKI